MNSVKSFDKISKQFRAWDWLKYVLKTCREKSPVFMYVGFAAFGISLTTSIIAMFLRHPIWRLGLPLLALAILFCGFYIFSKAVKGSLQEQHGLGDDLSFHLLHRYAKLELLKEALRNDSELETNVVDVLKKYVDNLLAYPSGGILLRHPLFTTFLSVVLSAIVSISITASSSRIDPTTLFSFVGTALVFTFALAVLLPSLSPLMDEFVLGEERFFHEMRTLLIMLEADLKSNSDS